jgi:hypothetical protein
MLSRAGGPEFLIQLRARCAPNGVGLFLENTDSRLLQFLRRHVIHRTSDSHGLKFWGFVGDDLEMFHRAFGSVQAKRYMGLVWAIRAGQAVEVSESAPPTGD